MWLGVWVLLASAGIVAAAAAWVRVVYQRRHRGDAARPEYDLSRADTVRILPPPPARVVGSYTATAAAAIAAANAMRAGSRRPVPVRQIEDLGPGFSRRGQVHVGVVVDPPDDVDTAGIPPVPADWSGGPWPPRAVCDQPDAHQRMPDDDPHITSRIFHATMRAFHHGLVLGPDGQPQHSTGLTGPQDRVQWDDGLVEVGIDSDGPVGPMLPDTEAA